MIIFKNKYKYLVLLLLLLLAYPTIEQYSRKKLDTLAPQTHLKNAHATIYDILEYLITDLEPRINYESDGPKVQAEMQKTLSKILLKPAKDKSIPYNSNVVAFVIEVQKTKYILTAATKPLDKLHPFLPIGHSGVGITALTLEEFAKNSHYQGSSNHIPEVAIAKPIVYQTVNGLEEFSYQIKESELVAELERFEASFEKIKHQKDDIYAQYEKELDTLKEQIIDNIKNGIVINRKRYRKNAEALLVENFDKLIHDYESLKDPLKPFIQDMITDLNYKFRIPPEVVWLEQKRCEQKFAEVIKSLRSSEDAVAGSVSAILEVDIQNKVKQNIAEWECTFEYALYRTFMGNRDYEKVPYYLYNEIKSVVSHIIGSSSIFIGNLSPEEITDELKMLEINRSFSVLESINPYNYGFTTETAEASKAFLEYLKDKLNNGIVYGEQIEPYMHQKARTGYKASYIVTAEMESTKTMIEAKLQKLKDDQVATTEDIKEFEEKIKALDKMGEEFLSLLVAQEETQDVPDEGFILFTEDIDSYVLNKLLMTYPGKIKAIVSTKGSSSSHWVITAGQKGIPVVNISEQLSGEPDTNIFDIASSTRTAVVDSLSGTVFLNLDEAHIKMATERKLWVQSLYEFFILRLAEATDLPLDIIANFEADLNIVNFGGTLTPFDIRRDIGKQLDYLSKRFKIKGIGLVRTEYLYMLKRILNSQEMQSFYAALASESKSMPVTLRGFDYAPDKDMAVIQEIYAQRGESMPKLFGAQYYYKDPTGIGRELIKHQLHMIYEGLYSEMNGATDTPFLLRFMFPMVSTDEDIEAVLAIQKEVLNEALADGNFRAEALKGLGKSKEELRPGEKDFRLKGQMAQMPIGAMVETKSAVENIENIFKNFDFVSIGTNDLTKDTFQIDRDDAKSESYFYKLQPKLLTQIEKVIQAGIKHKKKVSICGELARNPLFMLFIIHLSQQYENPEEDFFPYVSLSISSVNEPEYRELLRNIDTEELTAIFTNWQTQEPDQLTKNVKLIYDSIINQIEMRPEVKELKKHAREKFFKQNPDINNIITLAIIREAA